MAKKVKTYQLKVPSSTDQLEIIREFVTGVARKVGFREDELNKIELAVDEASTNVVKHAYQYDDRKPVEIQLRVEPDKFVIQIMDKGKGFKPEEVKKPDMKEYLAKMRVGGLGIYLMKTMMDEVEFSIDPGKKNMVRMVKYITPEAMRNTRKVS